MGLARKGLVGAAAVGFLQSPRGRRVIADARRRLDTPENREKARRLVEQARSQARSRGSEKPDS